MKARGRKRRRRTREDVDSLLGRYHKSGKTVLEFSEAEGVADSSVYKWLREAHGKQASTRLLEVTPPSGMGSCITIRAPQGYRIEVPGCFSSEALKRILSVIEA